MRRRLTSAVIALVLGATGILIAQSTVVINPQVTGSWPGGRVINAITWQTDNAADIGASGANRPRHVYIAGNYYGNGATLTGITGATGGVSNTGSTSIASDSDNSGAEDIAFLTSTSTRWLVKGGTGHLVPNTNNTYDIGTSSLVSRVIYSAQYSNGAVPYSSTLYSAHLAAGTTALKAGQDLGETSGVSIIDLATTWNNAGNTPTAIKLNVLDTASNASSLLMDLQVGSASKFKVDKSGVITTATWIISGSGLQAANTSPFIWASWGGIWASSDGVFRLLDAAGTSFGRLQFGGTTNLFPALGRSSAALQVKLADNSGFTTIYASSFGFGSYSSLILESGDGILRLTNSTVNDFNRLQFGGTTNAYPALKRNGTGLQLRTADDSAFTDWQCQSVFATISMVIGSNYASAGQIRLSNDAQINWRNATNTGDIGGFSVKNDNALYCGNAVAPASSGTRYLIIDTAGKITSSASAPSGT